MTPDIKALTRPRVTALGLAIVAGGLSVPVVLGLTLLDLLVF